MKLITALHPAAAMALSIGGSWSSLEARVEAGPSLSQTFESLAGLGLVNGTGCVIDEDNASKNARAETERSCTNQQQQVDSGLAECIKRAKSAEKAAKEGSALFQQYFKTEDSGTRDKVAQFFATIADGCNKNGNQPVTVECTPNQSCTLPQTGDMELAAIATNQPGGGSSIQLCRSAFTMNGDRGGNQRRQDQGQNCQENLSKLGDLFVHEMSHATVSTGDVIYGKEGCLGLTTEQALKNADSFALFAQDVSAGCAAKPGTGTQPPSNGDGGNDGPPNNGNNPPNNGNNPPDNGNNPPNNGNNPPISGGDEMPPNNGNNPPNNGNNPPISGGNERPPNDSPISEIGGDMNPGDWDQPMNNGDGGNNEIPNDQAECDANDQFNGDANDQFNGDANDQFGSDPNYPAGNNGEYPNNQGGGDQFFGGDDEYLGNQGGGDQSFGGDGSFGW